MPRVYRSNFPWRLAEGTTLILDTLFYGYNNPINIPAGFEALRKRVTDSDLLPGISIADLHYYYDRQAVVQVHQRPPYYYIPRADRNKPFPRDVHNRGLFERFEGDIIYLSPGNHPQRVKFALVLVDQITRYAFAHPITNTTMQQTSNALRHILQNREIQENLKMLITDNGPEFGGDFTRYLADNHITHHKAHVGDKTQTSIVETAIRTLRETAFRYAYHHEEKQNEVAFWFEIVEAYNNHPHKRLHNKSPAEAKHEMSVDPIPIKNALKEDYDKRVDEADDALPRLHVGDYARIRLRAAKLNPLYKAGAKQYGEDIYYIKGFEKQQVELLGGEEIENGNVVVDFTDQSQVMNIHDIVVVDMPIHHPDLEELKNDIDLDNRLVNIYAQAGLTRPLEERRPATGVQARRNHVIRGYLEDHGTKMVDDSEEVGGLPIDPVGIGRPGELPPAARTEDSRPKRPRRRARFEADEDVENDDDDVPDSNSQTRTQVSACSLAFLTILQILLLHLYSQQNLGFPQRKTTETRSGRRATQFVR